MKIAICFSGHIRNFFDKGIESFNNNILYLRDQGHEVDIFFSVWNTYEPSTSHWNHLNYKPYVLIDENKQALLIPFHWFDTYFKPIDDLRNQILNQIISNHP
jgi:predicted mannosyl-3-phosphoglycerate phosphatase (HAD superfamily)